MTSVVHLSRAHQVYIGRGRGPWGNPFVIGVDGTRAEVIAKHRAMVFADPVMLQRIRRELRGKTLGCFCAPLACHGDTLAEIANMSDEDFALLISGARGV